MVLLLSLALILTGCSTWQAPPPFDYTELRQRAVTKDVKGVTLSATVLSEDENTRLFGTEIDMEEVQPIWIEVRNTTDQTLYLLRAGTDPDLFSPLEVAWSFHHALTPGSNARIDEQFRSLSFRNPIAPHGAAAGIIYTNPHLKLRLLNVDLLGQGEVFPFTLFPKIPGVTEQDTRSLLDRIAALDGPDYGDLATLRGHLQGLPMFAQLADGSGRGEPLNGIIIGALDSVAAALVRRGYRVVGTDLDQHQQVAGRSPDIVLHKAGQGGVAANWIRLWLAPFRYQQQEVYLAQLGRPLGGRFAHEQRRELQLQPDVDAVRNLLLGDMMYSGGLAQVGFLRGEAVTESRYFTDGIRLVLFFSSRPLDLSEVEFLDWYPALRLWEEARQNSQPGDQQQQDPQ